MTRKLKGFGLSLLAIIAMTAFSTATASAVEYHAGAASGSVKVQNIGEENITVRAGTWKCKVSEYNGLYSSSTVTTLTTKPTYKECSQFGEENVVIDTNGCEIRFNQPNASLVSTVDVINCTQPMAITLIDCTITIGNQTGLANVAWTNIAGSPDDLVLHKNITGLKYTQDPIGFFGCMSGTFTNGTWTGTSTVRAYNSGGTQVNLTVA
jgi:hypothetical protein